MKKLTLEEFELQVNAIHNKENLKVLNYINKSEKCEVKCLKCGTVYCKVAALFTDKRKVSICKNCFPTHTNIKLETYELPEGYEYVEKYNGMHNKVLIKHKCGFIWGITPNNIKLGKGCPKCNKAKSKGEQKIEQFLINNNIKYIAQFPIDILEHKLSIDFYLPDFDLYIEYNGEQHYHPVNFFGGQEKFEKQIALDNLKKKKLKEKLLIISYLDYDNIEDILRSSTTIPQGSTL